MPADEVARHEEEEEEEETPDGVVHGGISHGNPLLHSKQWKSATRIEGYVGRMNRHVRGRLGAMTTGSQLQ